MRVVTGWFDTFRGASAKSCASAMPLVDSTPTKTIKSVISRETGEHFIISISRIKVRQEFIATAACVIFREQTLS